MPDDSKPLDSAEFRADVAAELRYIRRDVKELREERAEIWKLLRMLENKLTEQRAKMAVWGLLGGSVAAGAVSVIWKAVTQ